MEMKLDDYRKIFRKVEHCEVLLDYSVENFKRNRENNLIRYLFFHEIVRLEFG